MKPMYTSRWQRAYNLYRELYRVWPEDSQEILRRCIHCLDDRERAQQWEIYREAYRKAKDIDFETRIKAEWRKWADEVREAA